MIPKEKAEELINNYINVVPLDFGGMHPALAKQCALIAIDEIINNNNKIPGNADGLHTDANSKYWQEVKQEIEKM